MQFQGDIKSRVFYTFGGSVQKNHLYGYAGEPRLGLAYVPVRPRAGLFHGTKLRANLATGVQEPSLATEYYEPVQPAQQPGRHRRHRALRDPKLGPERSRSADIGLDQNMSETSCVCRWIISTTSSPIRSRMCGDGDLRQYFGFCRLTKLKARCTRAELNSLAYRAEGAEVELAWQAPTVLCARRVHVSGCRGEPVVCKRCHGGDKGMPTENP